MRPLLVLFVLCAAARAQVAYSPARLSPVEKDFCHTCKRVANATFAGLGSATVYLEDRPSEAGSIYWLVVVTPQDVLGTGLYQIGGGCGSGHCDYVDRVVPSLRSFSYRRDQQRVVELGVELEIDRTRDLLETVPRQSAHWKQRLFVACGPAADATWTCRSLETTCERAAWVRTGEPAVQSYCVEPLPPAS